jgi:hypothetical protein
MGIQFDSLTTASSSSLTWIVDDLLSRGASPAPRHDAQAGDALQPCDLEAWVNALLRQAMPIVASRTGRAQLEAWLAAIEPSAG